MIPIYCYAIKCNLNPEKETRTEAVQELRKSGKNNNLVHRLPPYTASNGTNTSHGNR